MILSLGLGSRLFEKFEIRFEVYKNVYFGGFDMRRDKSDVFSDLFSSESTLSKSRSLPVKSVVETPVVLLISLKRPMLLSYSQMLTPLQKQGSSP